MRIDRRSFCGLANSVVWQHWLAEYDRDLYIHFLNVLKTNKGCSDNHRLMEQTLDTIMGRPDGEDDIRVFLDSNFPYMILDRSGYNRVIITELRDFFSSNIITFPHRQIMTGENLEARVRDFCSSKLRSMYLVADDVAFVEYLDHCEIEFLEEIPERSWLLSKYKISRRIQDGQ